jgi:hypothetical protein
MKSAYKTFPRSSTAKDPATGKSYSSQYDIFTVGAGYLDIQAALSSTDLAPLTYGIAKSRPWRATGVETSTWSPGLQCSGVARSCGELPWSGVHRYCGGRARRASWSCGDRRLRGARAVTTATACCEERRWFGVHRTKTRTKPFRSSLKGKNRSLRAFG